MEMIQVFAFTKKSQKIEKKLCTQVLLACDGREAEFPALWDTGATISCISHEVVQALGLVPTGRMEIKTVSGTKTVETYLIDVKLPNDFPVSNVAVCDSEIGSQGIGFLIGMDIISRGDFAVSNHNGKTYFTFRIPSAGHMDFVQELKLKNITGTHGTGKRKKTGRK